MSRTRAEGRDSILAALKSLEEQLWEVLTLAQERSQYERASKAQTDRWYVREMSTRVGKLASDCSTIAEYELQLLALLEGATSPSDAVGTVRWKHPSNRRRSKVAELFRAGITDNRKAEYAALRKHL